MDNKYYTPELEDLFIGYECQYLVATTPQTELWRTVKIENPFKLNEIWDILNKVKEGEIRVNYLTKEDIESEGFETYPYTNDYLINYRKFLKDNTQVDVCIRKNNIIRIYIDYELVFNGECKSINEFRKIIKWLKING